MLLVVVVKDLFIDGSLAPIRRSLNSMGVPETGIGRSRTTSD
jgi:hypothetical protein